MVKHLKDRKMSKKVDEFRMLVKNIWVVKIQCPEDYIKLKIQEKLGHFILHIGTYDLNSDREVDLNLKSIVHLARTLKNKSIWFKYFQQND